MSQTADSPAPASPKAAKASKADRPKKISAKKTSANHPKYVEMVAAAIESLKERTGSSRQAIVKYIMSHYNVGTDLKKINSRVKVALKSGVKGTAIKQVKGIGASGSFKMAVKSKCAKKVGAKKATPKKSKKPAAGSKKSSAAKLAKAKTPKKAAAAKKPMTPKKSAASKKPKKAAAKKPNTPKKAAAAKKSRTPAKAVKAAKPAKKVQTPKKAAATKKAASKK